MKKIRGIKIGIFCVFFVLYVCGAVLSFRTLGSHWLGGGGDFFGKQKMPHPVGGVLDFGTDSKSQTLDVDLNLCGEWEFFYNRWIVTDKAAEATPENPHPDGTHILPQHWTGKRLTDGRVLPKTGYASYRLTLKNLYKLPARDFYIAVYAEPSAPYRVFFNDVLVLENGTLSKNRREVRFGLSDPGPYQKETPPLRLAGTQTVVLELGDNRNGGLSNPVWLVTQPPSRGQQFWKFFFPITVFGAMAVNFLFCIFTYVLGRREKNRTSPASLFLLGAVLLNFLFIADMSKFSADILGISLGLMPVFRFLTQGLVYAAMTVWLVSLRVIRLRRGEAVGLGALCGGGFLSYFPLMGTYFQCIPMLVPGVILFYLAAKLIVAKEEPKKTVAALLLVCLSAFPLAGEAFEDMALLNARLGAFFGVGLCAVVVPLVLINIYRILHNQKRLRQASENEGLLEVFRARFERSAAKNTATAVVTTFGLFDISVQGLPILFSRNKSKELLAFLIDKKGAVVPTSTVFDALWEGKSPEHAKTSYHDAVWRLKRDLRQVGLEGLIINRRGEISLKTDWIDCDRYRAEETGDFSAYQGQYMSQYGEWTLAGEAQLDERKDR